MKSKIEKIGYFLVPSSTSEGVTDALQSLADKLNEIIDHLNSQAQPEENEPEKVYVDPIVPNFTGELSAPVEYKTREQVKEMFKDTPEEWEEEWYSTPVYNQIPFIKDLLDKAREEGRLESANEQLAEIELSRNGERKRTLEEIIRLLDVKRTHGLSEMFVVDQIVRMLDGISKLKQ